MYAVPRVGRKWAMVGSSALMGVSLFLFATVNTQASNIGLNAMEYFFQSMFNASFWGRLFSIIAPLIAAHLLSKGLNAPLYLAGAGVFVCTIAIISMPTRSLSGKSF